MLITGSFSEIEKKLNRYMQLFKENVLSNSNYIVDLRISANGHPFIMIDRTTLREVGDNWMSEFGKDTDMFVVDEELYRLLSKVKPTVQELSLCACEDCKYKTALNKPKTDVDKDETATEDIIVHKKQITKESTSVTVASSFNVPILNDEYCIEEHLEESMRLGKPCVFGLKYVSDNVFALYYRKSVYDKGADTTFRHYLCRQPGILVAYRYFKELRSLRYQFEVIGKKLRHNGQNLLSQEQSDRLVHYFTKCWI